MMENVKYIGMALCLAGMLGTGGAYPGNFSTGLKAESEAGLETIDAAEEAEPEISDSAESDSEEKIAGEKDEDYIYCVGSVSKVYATAAVMQLVDEGKVELDAPVTDYVPEFRLADERYKKITVRMLMDHTSGMMGTVWSNGFLYEDGNSIRHDSILDIWSGQRLKAEPGEYAAYCNDGFDLLEQIVEHVSGMSYTEYITKYIAEPTGGFSTGTGANYYDNPLLIPTYRNFIHYDNGICLEIGAGGIYATASDVANFGAGFFTGNNAILSDESKNAMSERWGGDKFSDKSGLGWDIVDKPEFEEAGVKVVGKGGDALQNHTFLYVAPEEEVSVAVISNEGSSDLDALMAEELMKIVMEEKGIEISAPETVKYELLSEIPAEYDEYAGYYAFSFSANGEIGEISFPDHKYMHIEYSGAFGTRSTDYMLTTEGSFAELSDDVMDGDVSDARTAGNAEILTFVKDAKGSIYIGIESKSVYPGIGTKDTCGYTAEKMTENPVSSDVMTAWAGYAEDKYYLVNERYDSASYDMSSTTYVVPSEVMPGYAFFVSNNQGSRLIRIEDTEHAGAFQTIPSSANRDLIDIEVTETEEGLSFTTNEGRHYISGKSIPVMDGTVTEVELKSDKASWYKISEDLGNSTITAADRPENSNIIVYNKYGAVVYTTHRKDEKSEIPLPMDGMILFLGEDGGVVSLEH